ncbi:MAG: c-type cytochrome [Betaproteobacteria bacterium]|nr:MAG: c-type cytochrome [Betaproteobacteria bacterium]
MAASTSPFCPASAAGLRQRERPRGRSSPAGPCGRLPCCPIEGARLKKTILVGSLLAFAVPASAQDALKSEQVKTGSEAYARHCAACHGPRMADPEGAPDLRKFPRDQRERFLTSVSKGKNSMPPWGDLLKPDEIEALWAYVTTGGN